MRVLVTGASGALAPFVIRALWGFCRKVRFLGQNPKIGYQKFNALQTAKLSQKQLAQFRAVCSSVKTGT
jgi:hypothetical protein